MENKDQPAFSTGERHGDKGVTKREYLAFQLMAAHMINPTQGSHNIPKNAVAEVVEITDLLLAALNERK